MIRIIIISFLLDNIFSYFINNDSLFFPLFTLLSFIIILYYKPKEYNYFIMCVVMGLIYDIVFTDSLFLNASLFLISGLIIYVLFFKLNYNLLNVLLVGILIIIYYRVISYLLFIMNYNVSFNLLTLLKGIYSSIIINVIYIIIVYFITAKAFKSSK